jgi:hypothetical protein
VALTAAPPTHSRLSDYRDSDGSAARGNKHCKARPRLTVLQITYGSICDHHLVAVPASSIFLKPHGLARMGTAPSCLQYDGDIWNFNDVL